MPRKGGRDIRGSKHRHWAQWLITLNAPLIVADVHLVGLPGRLRLPPRWRASGRLEHEHLLYLVAEGNFTADLGGKKSSVRTGDFLWVSAGTPFHCSRASGAPLAIWRLRVRVEKGVAGVPAPWPWRIITRAAATAPWLELLATEAGSSDAWHAARVRGLLLTLFSELARIDTAELTLVGQLTAAQRTAISRFISDFAGTRASPRDLAKVLGFSADYFSRCFRRSYGCSPRRWLLEQRIRHAAERVRETKLSVGEIAGEFGYENLFLFSRQFKAVMGHSPLVHRRGG
jgi:AraC-like DNA-binding protein